MISIYRRVPLELQSSAERKLGLTEFMGFRYEGDGLFVGNHLFPGRRCFGPHLGKDLLQPLAIGNAEDDPTAEHDPKHRHNAMRPSDPLGTTFRPRFFVFAIYQRRKSSPVSLSSRRAATVFLRILGSSS
jgi:hypothetical protein